MDEECPPDPGATNILSEGVPCLILRTTCRTGCVIQLQNTGATVEIELNTPLDLSRACLICAIHPVRAVVKLGQLKGYMIRDCELLSVDWPAHQEFAPPVRYQRKKRQGGASTHVTQDTMDSQ
jgi:hypothetical protein